MEITQQLVKTVIAEHYPEFAHLAIKMVEKSGHDHRTFHLGETMSVRLPSGAAYASQIEKEGEWLPRLQPFLTWQIPVPIAQGKPSATFPFPFAIYQWLEGEVVSRETVTDLNQLALDLADFLNQLQAIDARLGPVAGAHNFYRGGALVVYDAETRAALAKLKAYFACERLEQLWNRAMASRYEAEPVFVHGDVAVGNLLVREGKLAAVIDFGILGTGDPACDYVMAWTFFRGESRKLFKAALNCDAETLQRAQGWALWKAVISYDPNNETTATSQWAKQCIEALLADCE